MKIIKITKRLILADFPDSPKQNLNSLSINKSIILTVNKILNTNSVSLRLLLFRDNILQAIFFLVSGKNLQSFQNLFV